MRINIGNGAHRIDEYGRPIANRHDGKIAHLIRMAEGWTDPHFQDKHQSRMNTSGDIKGKRLLSPCHGVRLEPLRRGYYYCPMAGCGREYVSDRWEIIAASHGNPPMDMPDGVIE